MTIKGGFSDAVRQVFEPTSANCTVGSYASLSVCIKKSLEKNHISKSIEPRVMKFGHDLLVYLEGQGQRPRSPGQKRDFLALDYHCTTGNMVKFKDWLGQGQRPAGSRSK